MFGGAAAGSTWDEGLLYANLISGRREQGIFQIDEKLKQAQDLYAQRQVSQAESVLREVLKHDASNREALQSLVIIYLQGDRAGEAQQHLQFLVASYPAEQVYCERLVTLLLSRDKTEQAIAAYRTLLSASPKLNDMRYNLGRLLKRCGSPELALQEYRQCLRDGIDKPEDVHTNMSVIHTEAHNTELAESALRSALSLNPDYVPALYNLALLQEEAGDWRAARPLFVNILELEPLHAGALAHIAAAEQISDPVAPLLRSMKRASRQDGLSNEAQEQLLYALGKAHDDLQRFDDAFEYYMRANQYSRMRVGDYQRKSWEQTADAVIQHCDQAWLETIKPVSEQPVIFICGMFRSGSTLLEQILAAHPALAAAGEIDYFRPRLRPLPAALLELDNDQAQALGQGYLDYLAQNFADQGRVTNKRPDNFLYLGLIKALFPNARIFHSTRAPVDVCLSIFFQSLDPSLNYANDLLDIAHYYRHYRRLMGHWQHLCGQNICHVSYESVVDQPRQEIAAALAFLDLEWHEGCLEFYAADTRVRTASLHQVRRPLYQSSAGRWENYAPSIGVVVEYLKDTGSA